MVGGGGWGARACGIRGRCSPVHVCCSGRHSGTVDVQRLAVLLRSMEHAEVHTFFQRLPGCIMHTHTDTHTEETHDQRVIHVHPDCVMTLWKQRPAGKRLLNKVNMDLHVSVYISKYGVTVQGLGNALTRFTWHANVQNTQQLQQMPFLDHEYPHVTHSAAILLSFMTF